MQENVWLPQDRLAAAEEITSESFIKRAKKALIRRRVTSHIHGDLSQEAALALYDQSIAILGPNEGEIQLSKSLILADYRVFLFLCSRNKAVSSSLIIDYVYHMWSDVEHIT